MKLLLLGALLIITNCEIVAQQFYVRLQSEPIVLKKNIFYISKVIDSRKDKTNIGFVFQGSNSNTIPALMDVQSSIGEFLQHQMPACDSCIAIEMIVENLQISEKMEGKKYRSDAVLDLVFLAIGKNKDQIGTFTTKSSATSIQPDVRNTHERHIRECLEDALNQLTTGLLTQLNNLSEQEREEHLTDTLMLETQNFVVPNLPQISPETMMRYDHRSMQFMLNQQISRNRDTIEEWLDVNNDKEAQMNIHEFYGKVGTTYVLAYTAGFCIGFTLGSLIFYNSIFLPVPIIGLVSLAAIFPFVEAANTFGDAIANRYNLKLGMTQLVPGGNSYAPTLGLQFNLSR